MSAGKEVRMVVRCKPWSNAPVGTHRVMVDVDGNPAHCRVRVWGPIGKIYTVCHALSRRAEARIVALAVSCRETALESARDSREEQS